MTWDVPNPKGRIASILAVILWSALLTLLVLGGNRDTGSLLLMALFALLLALSCVRLVQEWRENGDWLE